MIVVIVALAVLVVVGLTTVVVTSHRRSKRVDGSAPPGLGRPSSFGEASFPREEGRNRPVVEDRLSAETLEAVEESELLEEKGHLGDSHGGQEGKMPPGLGSSPRKDEPRGVVELPHEEAVAPVTPPEAAPSSELLQAPFEETTLAAPPRLRDRLGKVRQLMSGYVTFLRSRSVVSEESWEELEEALIRADVGVATTQALLAKVRSRLSEGPSGDSSMVLDILKDELVSVLSNASSTSASTPPCLG